MKLREQWEFDLINSTSFRVSSYHISIAPALFFSYDFSRVSPCFSALFDSLVQLPRTKNTIVRDDMLFFLVVKPGKDCETIRF